MSDQPVARLADAAGAVAGNGILDRRLLLRQGLVFGAMAWLPPGAAAGQAGSPRVPGSSRPPWMREPGREFSPYGVPARFEQETARFPAPNRVQRNNGASWTPLHLLEGTITPNGLHFERHHNGVPDIDPGGHELLIHGLVNRALAFSVPDLLRYPLESRTCFIECGGNSNAGWNRIPSRSQAGFFHGLVSNSEWTGVPLGVLLHEAGVKPGAKWVVAEGADAFAMHVSIPLAKLQDDALLALYQNGERLRPENGYPMRLVLPGWEGVVNVKWMRRLELTDQPVMARNETARYTDLMPDGTARMFSFVMEVKSLITSPSSGMVLKGGPGLYQVTGLAWSGRGRIRRVEISADNGRTWADAELQEPVLPKAFARFRIPWRWSGAPAVLKSRATDETGNVQPERRELIAQRGRHGFYHYNGIVNWSVDENGVLGHVYDEVAAQQTGTPDIDADWD
ncbi:MAG: sulfite dehydrogenase [Gammaproteobacteria bacterium]|nr:sulfite dehydrogenase [Gammaproteobacteria bacterium]